MLLCYILHTMNSFTTQHYTYTIKRSKRARYLRIEISTAAQVSVVIPYFVSYRQAHDFVKQKNAWIQKSLNKTKDTKLLQLDGSREEFLKYKHLAETIIRQKIEYWNEYYLFDYNRVFIKNMKTQWGSCSSKKNLNFNYKCIFLNEAQLDYIVVHELCHLQEMNHGPHFWELVSQQIPDYKKRVREIRAIRI